MFFISGNSNDDVRPTNDVLSEIMNKGHVMHMRFSLDHLQPSPLNRALFVTEVLSGKLNLFQKEFINSHPLVMIKECFKTYWLRNLRLSTSFKHRNLD